MLKSELVARLAQKIPQVPVRTVNDSVNQLIELMSNALAHHQRIEIRGFGSFTMKLRKTREAHNPKTGVKIITHEKFSPHFKPGKALKADINAAQATTPLVMSEDLD